MNSMKNQHLGKNMRISFSDKNLISLYRKRRKKMKKKCIFIALFLQITLCVFAGGGNVKKSGGSKTAIEQGLSLISLMKEKAEIL